MLIRLIRNKKGQSAIEYGALLAITIAAILGMQAFLKRGVSGAQKKAADDLGTQFSAGNTTIYQERKLNTAQYVESETNTDASFAALAPEADKQVHTKGFYTLEERTGGESTTEQKQYNDAASQEDVRWAEYDATTENDFADPF